MRVPIYYGVPYDSGKNLGMAYNFFADRVPDNAWLCLMDADTMPTTPDYGTLIEDIILAHPEVSAFTAMTNRVNCPWQVYEAAWNSDDMVFHRNLGKQIKEHWGTQVADVTYAKHLMSGFFLCIKKSLWNEIGGAREHGMLGVDNNIHRRIRDVGDQLWLAKGLYFYHWYRGGNRHDTSHLQ